MPTGQTVYYSSTVYGACGKTLQYTVDSHPHLSLRLESVPVVWPISDKDLIEATRRTIEHVNECGGKVRLALVDAISSNPGVAIPWQELCSLFRANGILSLVDAAHSLGQEHVDLRRSQPDFWVSNAHKWLYAHHACAALYVAKK
jgi:hercynylcysteine S-oxide lyase